MMLTTQNSGNHVEGLPRKLSSISTQSSNVAWMWRRLHICTECNYSERTNKVDQTTGLRMHNNIPIIILYKCSNLKCGVCGKDVAVPSQGNIRIVHTTYTAALKTTTHPKIRCRKPYAPTRFPVLLMMGVCTRNMSSWEYINKITWLHQVGISRYFTRKMHGQTTLKLYAFYFEL